MYHIAPFVDAHAVSVWTRGAKRQDKMCRQCKPTLDSDWLLRHIVVALELPENITPAELSAEN